jgi:hypothetical protein
VILNVRHAYGGLHIALTAKVVITWILMLVNAILVAHLHIQLLLLFILTQMRHLGPVYFVKLVVLDVT